MATQPSMMPALYIILGTLGCLAIAYLSVLIYAILNARRRYLDPIVKAGLSSSAALSAALKFRATYRGGPYSIIEAILRGNPSDSEFIDLVRRATVEIDRLYEFDDVAKRTAKQLEHEYQREECIHLLVISDKICDALVRLRIAADRRLVIAYQPSVKRFEKKGGESVGGKWDGENYVGAEYAPTWIHTIELSPMVVRVSDGGPSDDKQPNIELNLISPTSDIGGDSPNQ